MKRSKRCPKCKSDRIGSLSHLPDTVGKETEVGWRHVGVVKTEKGTSVGVGRLTGYVCTQCGYLEMYVADPEQTPFEEIEAFSWHTSDDGPYR